MTAPDLGAFARARDRRNDAETRVREAARALANAELAANDPSLADLRAAVRRRREDLAEANARIRDLSDRLTVADRFEPLVESMPANFPVALFPVRIETRFSPDQLRIRIFPDQVHLDQHESALSDAEVTAGRWYWAERWHDDAARATAAWQELARLLGARRARWVVDRLTPENLAALGSATAPRHPEVELRDASLRQPVQARALPDRWMVMGLRQDRAVFVKWSGHVPDSLAVGLAVDPAPDEDSEESAALPAAEAAPALDADAMWMVDFTAAEEKGMAVSIGRGDLIGNEPFEGGFDRLVVLGLDWTKSPEQSADDIADLLRGHLYSDGFGFVPNGTPTNSTEVARAGVPGEQERLVALLDPLNGIEPLAAESAGRRTEAALGLAEGRAHLDRAYAAGSVEAAVAGHVLTAVWEATAGYYLDQLMDPLIDDATIDRARAHATEFLRPGGPVPSLRAGQQPYGVLPVVASSEFKPGERDAFSGELHSLLARLRPAWQAAIGGVPRLGMGDDPDAELVKVLQQSPVASAARFRRVYGPEAESNLSGLERLALAQQHLARLLGEQLGGFASAPRLQGFTTDHRSYPLSVPWAIPTGHQADQPLPYIADIARLTRDPAGRAALTARENAGTLLEALLAHSALLELDRAAARVVARDQQQHGVPVTERFALRTPELTHITSAPAPAANEVVVSTPLQLASLVLPSTTGHRTVSEFVADRLNAGAGAEVSHVAEFLQSLDVLATRPATEVEWAFRGVLDALSTRIDAWYTSLATRRLDELRRQHPVGTHTGCYGWLFDVRPDTAPDSLGYLHAPSLEQAKTLAILRSGHLAHRGSDERKRELLNINLDSTSVMRAQWLLDAVARGQSYAALLGYRIERGLRDRDVRLARFIAPMRDLAPMRPPIVAGAAAQQRAVRDVVDGVALMERWRDDRNGLLDKLKVERDGERAGVTAVLDEVFRLVDAVSDLVIAQATQSLVGGSLEEARSALAVLDRQERAPEFTVARTSRSGTSCQHRVLLLLRSTNPGTWKTRGDIRSAAEPRINAWVAQLLGPQSGIRYAARVMLDGEEVASLSATPADVGLSPISLMLAAASPGTRRATALEDRLESIWASRVAQAGEGATLEILAGPPATSGANVIGFRKVQLLLQAAAALVQGRRAATRADVALPDRAVASGVDHEEIERRADDVTSLARAAARALETVLARARPTKIMLQRAIASAGKAGFVSSSSGEDVEHLRADVATLAGIIAPVIRKLDGVEATPPGADADQRVAHHLARIRAVLGEGFPVLVPFDATSEGDLETSDADRQALVGDGLSIRGWLQQVGMVRPGVELLKRVLTANELMRGPRGADEFRAWQLPHRAGAVWAALPQPPGQPLVARLSLGVHAPSGISFAEPFAGLVCDEWLETIPGTTETTGLSFHYDAPGSRAPQAILLAVPGDSTRQGWSLVELLDAVQEVADLVRTRMVGPAHLQGLGLFLPMTYLPHNFKHDVPSVDIRGLVAGLRERLPDTAIRGKTLS